jgi:hypothetical protein
LKIGIKNIPGRGKRYLITIKDTISRDSGNLIMFSYKGFSAAEMGRIEREERRKLHFLLKNP